MKHVIITGANGNLGQAVTKKFLDSGYMVIATVRDDSGKKELPENKNLKAYIVDLSNEKDAAEFAATCISEYKNIHALLMLVGGFAMGNIKNTEGALIRKQFALNFETAYFIARPIFGHMMENNSGRLVFIGSRPALDAAAGKDVLAYALSKSMLFKLAEYLNEEGKGKNVTASVLAPGIIDTDLNRQDMPSADFTKWVKPEAIADVLEWIVSKRAAGIREGVYKVYGE